MGATVAGFGGVVERERREGREEMGRCGQMDCQDVRASRGSNWVMRFIMEDTVDEVKFGSRHGAFRELFKGMFALFAFSRVIPITRVAVDTAAVYPTWIR